MPVSAHASVARGSRAGAAALTVTAGKLCAAGLLPGLLLLIGQRLPVLNPVALGFLLVLLVGCLGSMWGGAYALAGSAVSIFGYHFLLLPEHGPGHWIALLAFMIAILGVGSLCGS